MLIYLADIEAPRDKSRFVQIYETYQGLMFHTAFRLLGQPQDAEDAGEKLRQAAAARC